MKDAKKLAKEIAIEIAPLSASYTGGEKHINLPSITRHMVAAMIERDREEVRAEERATIMAEVQDGGKSCHWCRSAIVAEERKACAERALKFVESMLSDADMDRLYAAILADEPSHD